MKICVIGWYGTETLGDRAILDGMLSIFCDAFDSVNIELGSLFPFFTERTLWEDSVIYKQTAPNSTIHIFNIKDQNEAQPIIQTSDLVVIGGGPLMGLNELKYLCNCFEIAKRKNIPRIIFGCGIGPFRYEYHISLFKELIKNATAIYLRDQYSYCNLFEILNDVPPCYVLGDPALVSIYNYMSNATIENKSYIAVNFRLYPGDEYGHDREFSVKQGVRLVQLLCERNDDIQLIPMHTFAIGGDDRLFLSQIRQNSKNSHVFVQSHPMNLHQLYKVYTDAYACIGMRYHAVMMESILNGNNFIVNYTGKHQGKINGFINFLNVENIYKDRQWYINEEFDPIMLQALFEGEKNKFLLPPVKEWYLKRLATDLG